MRILAADLWPSTGVDGFNRASEIELASAQMRLHQFVENVLLYDQVVIPTDDFISLNVLAKSFGLSALETLLDEAVLKFWRLQGQLVYAGAGHGITFINSWKTVDGTPVSPLWLPTDIAVAAILRKEIPSATPEQAHNLAAKVSKATVEADLDAINLEAKKRSHGAAQSPSMDPRLAISDRDLNNLGIGPDQVRLLGRLNEAPQIEDSIYKLMVIARTQIEMIAGEQTACNDISTLSPVGKIIAANRSKTSLDRLYEITDVPDLGAAAWNGTVSMKQIVELRNSRNWQQFVQWFHETCAKEPDAVGREYVKLLRAHAPLDSPFFKLVRLLISTVAGALSGGLGVAVSAADAFLVPKIREPSAKYFIERLEQLSPTQIQP
jgi:hypothetical protein